jgi:hypothetical protein
MVGIPSVEAGIASASDTVGIETERYFDVFSTELKAKELD